MTTFKKGEIVRLIAAKHQNYCGLPSSWFTGTTLGVYIRNDHYNGRVNVKVGKYTYVIYRDCLAKAPKGEVTTYKTFIGSAVDTHMFMNLKTKREVVDRILDERRRKITGTMSCIKCVYNKQPVVILDVTQDGPPMPVPAKVRRRPAVRAGR